MAGARELKMATIAARREQQRRNAEATAEAEARRTEMEEVAAMSETDRRMWQNRRRRGDGGVVPIRTGRRIEYKSPLEFASKPAQELAEEAGLTPADFESVQPTGKKGYNTADVRAVIEAQEEAAEARRAEEEEKMQREQYEDKMDRGEDTEDKGEEEDTEEDDTDEEGEPEED